MSTTFTLEEAIERFAAGERARRETACRFLDALAATIQPVANDLWGDDDQMVTVTPVRDGKPVYTRLRYQFGPHTYDPGLDAGEIPGFVSYEEGFSPVKELRGRAFWSAIEMIALWAAQLPQAIARIDAGRAELVARLTGQL